jgi:hypothetical protein
VFGSTFVGAEVELDIPQKKRAPETAAASEVPKRATKVKPPKYGAAPPKPVVNCATVKYW